MSLPLKALHENPIVVRLALTLDSTPFSVAGRLRALWEYFETHAPNGAGMIGQSVIDMVICHDGFACALAEEGILSFDGDHVEVMIWRPQVVLDIAAPDESDPAWLAGWEAAMRHVEEVQAKEIQEQRAAARARKRTSRERRSQNVTVTSQHVTVTSCDILESSVSVGGKLPALPERTHSGTENARVCAGAHADRSDGLIKDKEGRTDRLMRSLIGRGIDPADALEILASPKGTEERIEWAFRKLATQIAATAEGGRRIRSHASYVKSLILKAANGPKTAPDPRPNPESPEGREATPSRAIGGNKAPHPQDRKVRLMQQIEAMKSGVQSSTAPTAQKV